MKKKIMLMLACVVASVSMQAQLNLTSVATTSQGPQATPGEKIVLLAKAIKPGSYLPTFKKDRNGYLTKAENSTDAAGMLSSISVLAAAIRPDKFRSGVTAAGLMKGASNIKNVSQANVLLMQLEAGLKPKAMSDIWQLQRNQWINDLKPGMDVGK